MTSFLYPINKNRMHSTHMISRRCERFSMRFSTKTCKPVGFIGLGLMGAPMAQHLLDAGHELIVHDIDPKTIANLNAKKDSLRLVQKPSKVASQCDTIITMLPTKSSIQEVYLSPETGLLTRLRSSHILIDSSTTCPMFTKELGKAVRNGEPNAIFMDAPVSGGTMGARNKTLTFMVGAENESHHERIKPILELMGRNIVHCGENGTGQIAKICNNLAFAIQMASVSEATLLGTTLGLDPKVLQNIMNTSTSECFTSKTYHPYPGLNQEAPSSKDYKEGFATSLCRKDLGLAVDCANQTEVALPLTFALHQIYSLMVRQGHGSKDFSFLLPFLKKA